MIYPSVRPTLTLLTALLLTISSLPAAETFIVENGQPRAEIVIAESPGRSVRLAAEELQDGLRKISGAHLPIVTTPRPGSVHLFVGRSEHTDALKLAVDELKDGAFRLVSGDDWLALFGQDTEFTPIEPWGRNNADLNSGRAQRGSEDPATRRA